MYYFAAVSVKCVYKITSIFSYIRILYHIYFIGKMIFDAFCDFMFGLSLCLPVWFGKSDTLFICRD